MKTRRFKKRRHTKKTIRKNKKMRKSKKNGGAIVGQGALAVGKASVQLTGSALVLSAGVIRGAAIATKKAGIVAEIGGHIAGDVGIGTAGVVHSVTTGFFGGFKTFAKTCYLLNATTDLFLSFAINSIKQAELDLTKIRDKCDTAFLSNKTTVTSSNDCLLEYKEFLTKLKERDITAIQQIKPRVMLNIDNCLTNIRDMMNQVGCSRDWTMMGRVFNCKELEEVPVEINEIGEMKLVTDLNSTKPGIIVSISKEYKSMNMLKSRFSKAHSLQLLNFMKTPNEALAKISRSTNESNKNVNIFKTIQDYNQLGPAITIEAELIEEFLNPIIHLLELLQQILKDIQYKKYKVKIKFMKEKERNQEEEKQKALEIESTRIAEQNAEQNISELKEKSKETLVKEMNNSSRIASIQSAVPIEGPFIPNSTPTKYLKNITPVINPLPFAQLESAAPAAG